MTLCYIYLTRVARFSLPYMHFFIFFVDGFIIGLVRGCIGFKLKQSKFEDQWNHIIELSRDTSIQSMPLAASSLSLIVSLCFIPLFYSPLVPATKKKKKKRETLAFLPANCLVTSCRVTLHEMRCAPPAIVFRVTLAKRAQQPNCQSNARLSFLGALCGLQCCGLWAR